MTQSTLFKGIAFLLSWLFHPLLILTYMICLLMLINPYSFGISKIGDGRSGLLIIYVFLQATLIPGIAISMMKGLGLVSSLDLNNRTNRIGPFIAAGVLYLWLYANFSQLSEIPLIFKSAILGSIIALFTAFMINLFTRISIHAVGMGALVGMILISMLLFSYSVFQIGSNVFSMYSLLFIAILLAGLVGSARIILSGHTIQDLYTGYLVGFATQLIALQFLG